MRIEIEPTLLPGVRIDATHAVTAAIASEIASRLPGSNDVVNWLEAERIVHAMLARPEPTAEHGAVRRESEPRRGTEPRRESETSREPKPRREWHEVAGAGPGRALRRAVVD